MADSPSRKLFITRVGVSPTDDSAIREKQSPKMGPIELIILPATIFSLVNGQQNANAIDSKDDDLSPLRTKTQFQRCITPGNRLGHCMHLLRCPLPEFKQDKLRFMDYFCIIDRIYVGVCCPDDFITQTGGPFGPGSLPTLEGGDTPAPESPQNPDPNKPPTGERKGCGENLGVEFKRVTGGRPADPKQWPWMVAIIRVSLREVVCGAVLITDRHILTAAHCLHRVPPQDVLIRLGEYNLRRIDETRVQNFGIGELIIHKDFNPNTYENDIAIIKLNRPSSLNTYAWPVCLPEPGNEFVSADAVVIGWGNIQYGGPSSDVLMEVSVPVWNNTSCQDTFIQPILDTNLCAGGVFGKDSCQGDSGGPLLHLLPNDRWVTIGIVSWGVKCGESRPAIYTRVNKYLDWILTNAIF